MRQYARRQTSILLRRLARQVNRAARADDADAIHDLRVAIRRLSRCLRVFSESFPGRYRKRVRVELSKLLQAAALVRDRDIALELLAEAGVSRRAPLARRLETERGEAARALLAELRRWEQRDFSRRWRTRLEL